MLVGIRLVQQPLELFQRRLLPVCALPLRKAPLQQTNVEGSEVVIGITSQPNLLFIACFFYLAVCSSFIQRDLHHRRAQAHETLEGRSVSSEQSHLNLSDRLIDSQAVHTLILCFKFHLRSRSDPITLSRIVAK